MRHFDTIVTCQVRESLSRIIDVAESRGVDSSMIIFIHRKCTFGSTCTMTLNDLTSFKPVYRGQIATFVCGKFFLLPRNVDLSYSLFPR